MELDLLGLLNREPLRIPEGAGYSFRGKRVVVTGAGGSIGGAIVERLIGGVDFLGMIGHSEAPIFRLHQKHGNCERTRTDFLVEDAGRNPEAWVDKWEPDLVIHAAAHKHVGLMEDAPQEAFRNNTENTIRIATACWKAAVPKFVFISTDKAAKPTSVMGASKRLAEAWLLSRPEYASVVRFGNVIGSAGSLVEIVYNRILKGETVTLTSELMRRYFITPDEAVDLVFAATEGPGLRSLEMGEPHLIADIIGRVATQLGKEYTLEITSPGSGEKEDEHLFNDGERDYRHTSSDVIRIGNGWLEPRNINQVIHQVRTGAVSIIEAANSVEVPR